MVERYTYEHYTLLGVINVKITEDSARDALFGEEFKKAAADFQTEETFKTVFSADIVEVS